jgi:hypothetical protein
MRNTHCRDRVRWIAGRTPVGIFRAWYARGACRLLDRLDGTAIMIE